MAPHTMRRPAPWSVSPSFPVTVLVLLALLALAAAVLAPPAAGAAPTEGSATTVLVLDVSGSMARDAADGGSLMDAARGAVGSLVDELPDDAQLGLRLYGHRVGNDDSLESQGCEDTELVVPVDTLDRGAVTAALAGLEPTGWTPIGGSLRAAAGDLADVTGPTSIVLVSDGEDTCTPPDPCDVGEELAADGIDLTIHTVGLATDDAANQQLSCIAESGGGEFLTADSATSLVDALTPLVARAARATEDLGGEPIEGTRTPNGAPAFDLGTSYQDTILLGEEELYYQLSTPVPPDVDISLDFEAPIWDRPGDVGDLAGAALTVELLDESYDLRANRFEFDTEGSQPAFERAEREWKQLGDDEQVLTMRIVPSGTFGMPDGVEVPFRFQLDIDEDQLASEEPSEEGSSSAEPSEVDSSSADPSESASPTPTATPSAVATGDVEDDQGSGVPVWLTVLLVALGVGGGFLLGRSAQAAPDGPSGAGAGPGASTAP